MLVQDQKFIFLNIYAPNKTPEKTVFFDQIKHQLDNAVSNDDSKIILGGDFNVVLDPNLDGQGGRPSLKESAKQIEDIYLSHDLVDIWRVRNPGTKRFSWRQKTPFIQRRLDYWLIDNALQEEIDQVDIISSIKSDHLAISSTINGIETETLSPSFWKLNASLLDDKEYVDLINHSYQEWIKEFKDVQDPRLFWDLLKYKIRQDTIIYSKSKARERREKMLELEGKLKNCQLFCDQDPLTEKINRLESLKINYDLRYEYMAQGAIIRSRANWYEQGEKSNKYFLNLEKSRGNKGTLNQFLQILK